MTHSFPPRRSNDLGAQPMTDTDCRYGIAFNGGIYNYLEFRRVYEADGARFRSNSDTEVILEGFKRKGLDVCRDLNGMFAFAIWDIRERRLFLARDRLGKKPLYWTVLSGSFFLASCLDRSEESRVGKECVITGKYRGSP